MAKAAQKAKGKGTNGTPARQTDGVKARPEGESISGYFRTIFAANPKLLKGRSNEAILNRWLADHPDETEVPDRIKGTLANIKSVLRKKRRQRRGASQTTEQPPEAATAPSEPRTPARKLEALEEQIDECLDLAKRLDREGLEDVIVLLRRARNGVVWKAGQ